MKTLSIQQPWASLICTSRKDNPLLGIKDIENRTWQTKYRGRFLIHASAKPAFTGSYYSNLPIGFWTGLREAEKSILLQSFQYRGAIIGEVTLVDCVINHSSIWAEKTESALIGGNICYGKKIWNWVLENPILYNEPILNVKGKLSFWEFEK